MPGLPTLHRELQGKPDSAQRLNAWLPRYARAADVSMMELKFTIPGEPQGKGRPKFSRHSSYVVTRTPDQSIIYENLVKMEFLRQCGAARFGDREALDMQVSAYYAIPASASKKKRQAMIDGEIRPTKKPDVDNILKIIADSLNEVAYKDDSQIADAKISKFYSTSPGVCVVIKGIGSSVGLPNGPKCLSVDHSAPQGIIGCCQNKDDGSYTTKGEKT